MDARGKFFMSKQKPETLHKKLYAATQRPTDVFNAQMNQLNNAIRHWDNAFDDAKKSNNEKAMEYAEAQRRIQQETRAVKYFQNWFGQICSYLQLYCTAS